MNKEICGRCDGTGKYRQELQRSGDDTCGMCGGRGFINVAADRGFIHGDDRHAAGSDQCAVSFGQRCYEASHNR